jgi:hypothetical protein
MGRGELQLNVIERKKERKRETFIQKLILLEKYRNLRKRI